MRSIFSSIIGIIFCFSILLFPAISFCQEEDQELKTEVNEADQVPEILVPDIKVSQNSSMPLFSNLEVMDNPSDSGGAILIRWLVTESSPVILFGKEEPAFEGLMGNWNVSRTRETISECEPGNKKKSAKEVDVSFYALHSSNKQYTVGIYRARSEGRKPLEPFSLIGTAVAGENLEAEEHRFSEDSTHVYMVNESLSYQTPGKRKVQNRFWQSFVDRSVIDHVSYVYRISISDGQTTVFCYDTIPLALDKNRKQFTLNTEFGPVTATLNSLPINPSEYEVVEKQYSTMAAVPDDVLSVDNPSDSGNALKVDWLPSKNDLDVQPRSPDEIAANPNPIISYLIFRSEIKKDAPEDFSLVGTVASGLTSSETEDQKFKDVKRKHFVDISASQKSWDYDSCRWYNPGYSYIVGAKTEKGIAFSKPSEKAFSKTQWFDRNRIVFLILALTISAAIIWFIQHIRSGKKLFVRKIAGLDAIDEAIGRATEMGRPILFIPGIQDINDVQTISAVIILGRIAKTIAEYDTKLMCPTSKSLVMTTARETVKEAYLSAGRPDAYNDDMITYLTDEQFGYVAGVNGIMVREKPATCFYLGAFFAESLILAETGNYIGAIQIAGTAQPAQLPFFIAACDYTLIGEELFAASAYLSHDPMQLGSLKGQDIGKLIAMIAIFAGVSLATLAELTGAASMQRVFEFFRNLFMVS